MSMYEQDLWQREAEAKVMTVADIMNKVYMLKQGMESSSKALALAMSIGSPEHVVKGLLKDYKRYSNQYYSFMKEEFKEVIK